MAGRDERAIAGRYEELFATGRYRELWEGEISRRYKLPKYLDVISRALFAGGAPLSVLEAGAGDGEIAAGLVARHGAGISAYTATELTAAGAALLGARLAAAAGGVPVAARRMDVRRLEFPDGAFDVACAFDLLHHLDEDGARQAARELARVASRRVLVIEANALSLPRRLMELTPRYRTTGEGSYYPWEYLRFFLEAGRFRRATARPFLFMVPHLPARLIGLNVAASEVLERLPLLRWQCSSVVLDLRK